MKYLVLILALLIAAPLPQTAIACMAEQGKEMPAPAVDSDSMDHEHDCCPSAPETTEEDGAPCEGADHCGACLAGASALPPALSSLSNLPNRAALADITPPLIPLIGRVFYRPPIA